MEKEGYNKHKDSLPEDTLSHIQAILMRIGIATENSWVENGNSGCYSNRITIPPTGLGANGKGTDKSYALASGYAELMERIQNNILYTGELSPSDKEYGGFSYFPDQKQMSADEILKENNPFTNYIFSSLGCKTEFDKSHAIKKSMNWFHCPNMEFECIPFADIDNKKIIYLPQEMLFAIYGSNGMAAGNSMEEALVQGLAEILERYVNRKIILEHICPPSVPRSYIEDIPLLNKIINKIEEGGNYQVVVKDCSLGRGLPVLASIIIDKKIGGFGVKFASHPSFQVALERTLTEAFQGRKLDDITKMNAIGKEQLVQSKDNILNMMKIGNGYCTRELIAGKPDYEFKPYSRIGEHRNNREMLRYMLGLVRQEGYHPLIRNSSFLGFHSYFIVVPGMSELNPVNKLFAREMQTYGKVLKSLHHLHSVTDEEALRIVRYISFKEGSALENRLEWAMGLPLTEKVPGKHSSAVLLKSCLLYQLKEFGDASREMDKVMYYQKIHGTEEEKEFFSCCASYLHFRAEGLEEEEIRPVLSQLYKKNVSEKVMDIFSGPMQAVKKMFPGTNCFDCEHCDMQKEKMCQYQEISALARKLKDAFKNNIPDQEKLMNILK